MASTPIFAFRLPRDLREMLEKEAKKKDLPLTREIVMRLRESFREKESAH